MLILSFDTATKALSIALTENGQLIDKIESFSEKTHSERLMPAIDEILKRNEITFSAIDLIAVGNGPGSYTGIRIALSTALGLVHSTSTPLITVSTLQAMTSEDNVLEFSLLDARGGRLFVGGYMGDDSVFDDQQTTADVLATTIHKDFSDRKIRLLGNGAPILAPLLDIVDLEVSEERWPDAFRLALLAERKYEARGQGMDLTSARPFYAAPTQAERMAKDK